MPPLSFSTVAVDLPVRRIDFGYFVRPAEETGTGSSRVEPCLGYLIFHPHGVVLVDTGMGFDPEVDEHYRPCRRTLAEAVADAGISVDDVRHVVNCHLHFDHCGGNPELTGRPIYTQRVELDAAREPGYTLPQLVDASGLSYQVLDGEAEILDRVFVVPTPGHTAGHQSLVVLQGDGSIVVAGQSHDNATAFGSDVLVVRANSDGHVDDLPSVPDWIERLQRFEPRQVVFAHDGAVWQP